MALLPRTPPEPAPPILALPLPTSAHADGWFLTDWGLLVAVPCPYCQKAGRHWYRWWRSDMDVTLAAQTGVTDYFWTDVQHCCRHCQRVWWQMPDIPGPGV